MMKKTDEQLAQELDAFLTAQLRGRPLSPTSDAIKPEVDLAADLLHLADTMEPDPIFLSGLEAQLTRAASRQKSLNSTAEGPTLWDNFLVMIKEQFVMKRTVFALGAVMALFVFGYFAWSAWQSTLMPEPAVIADTGAPRATPDPATLPSLPSLGGASGLGGGLGGGGAESDGAESLTLDPMDGDGRFIEPSIMWDPLSEATYVLNSTLPGEPTFAPVYEQPGQGLLTLEDVAHYTGLFGLTGSIYRESYPPSEDLQWTPSTVYQVFDGSRQLSMSDTHLYYYDQGEVPQSESEMMPFAQSAVIAEAFLRERGLLDFPYRMMSQNGYDVEFRRVIDGYEVAFPEFQAAVNGNGRVWSLSYSPLDRVTAVADYPVRSAEAAWQLFLSEGVDYQRSFFMTYPGPDFEAQPPVREPAYYEELYRYWQRTFEDGDTITLYPYPIVYLPVSADASAISAPPRVLFDQYLVVASEQDLWAIAEHVARQIHVVGTVRHTESGQVIELQQWAPVEYEEYAFREGTIQRDGDQTWLLATEGERLMIPDAPADLADGERVYVSGWLSEADDAAYPVFNWQGMGRIVEEADMLMPDLVEPDELEPYKISEVIIEQVELIYAVNHIFEEGVNANMRFLLQPVWRFKGSTNNGEIIEIYVQAVDDAFLQPSTP